MSVSSEIPTNRFVKVRKLPVVVKAKRCNCTQQITTLEGVMTANPGDIIIEGVNGERYPCKPDIFDQTYESVEETSP